MKIQIPKYGVLTLAQAADFDFRGYELTEKMDGTCAERNFSGCVVTGEAMPDGRFYAWGIPVAFGQDIRRSSTAERNLAMNELFSRLNPKLNWHRPATGFGFEFVEAVLARGGEGVVAKNWQAPFGHDWAKIKRSETFICRVEEKSTTKQSVRLSLGGKDAGGCLLFGSKFETVRVGSVLKIEGYGLTAAGRIREPRPCKDSPTSWLISV